MHVPLCDTYYFKFTTRQFSTGAPFTLGGTPALSVYEENNATQITAGITLTVDYDSVTGMNDVAVVASTGNGYEVGKYYDVVITTGTVDSVSVVGEVVGKFRVMPAEDAGAGITDVNVTHVGDSAEDISTATALATAQTDLNTITGSDGVTLATAQALYAPAKAGDSMDILSISGDTTAADNLEAMYDGTGYIDDTAPASRDQINSIVATGSAVNVASSSFTLTTGSQVNTYTSTVALDGTRHELTDSTGDLDGYYVFDVGGDGIPTSVTITGVFQGPGDDFTIQVNTGSTGTPSWSTRGTITGSGSTNNVAYSFDLFSSDVATDDISDVRIRILGSGLTTSSFDVDQIFISKAVVNRSVGYARGAIWVDTNASNTSTESYVDGVADNPVSTIAAAATISSNLGLNHFYINAGSSIQFTSGKTTKLFEGEGWTLDLNGQDISNSHFYEASVSGIGTTASGNPDWHLCNIGTATIGPSDFHSCDFSATFTAGTAGDYFIYDSHSAVAGSGSPTFDFNTNIASATNLAVRNWAGGGTWTLNSNVTASIEVIKGGTHSIATGGANVEFRGFCKALTFTGVAAASTVNVMAFTGVINVNGTGGTVNVYGQHSGITDNSSGSVTINDFSVDGPAVGTNVAAILTDTNELQTDWTNGGRLDAILDELTTQGDTNETKLDTLTTNVATVDTVVDGIQTDLDNGTDGLGAIKATADAIETDTQSIETKVDTVDANVDAILVDTASIGITKNAAFSNLEFLMVDSTDFVTPETGITVSGERSIDGGAFAALNGSSVIAEVGNGIYQVDLAAVDTNGDVITYRFTGTGCADRFITIKTRA